MVYNTATVAPSRAMSAFGPKVKVPALNAFSYTSVYLADDSVTLLSMWIAEPAR